MNDIMHITVDDEFERRLIQRALNRDPSMPLIKALDLVYGGAAMACYLGSKPDIIHFEEGPDVLRLKGVWPTTLAMVIGRYYGVEDYWGDPLSPIAVKHVWLRTMMNGHRTDYDYVVGNGHPGGRGGSYKATIVGDAESMSVYTEDVELTPLKVALDPETCRTVLEFRRLISIGQEIT